MEIAQTTNSKITIEEVDGLKLNGMKGAIAKVCGSSLSGTDIKNLEIELSKNGKNYIEFKI